MTVKDIQELAKVDARIRIVELQTYNVLARSWTQKGIRRYADREVKSIGTAILNNNGYDIFPVINLYI